MAATVQGQAGYSGLGLKDSTLFFHQQNGNAQVELLSRRLQEGPPRTDLSGSKSRKGNQQNTTYV